MDISFILSLIFLFYTVPRSHIDDEYASSIYREPLVLLTSCRDPSSRLMQFAKVLFISNRNKYISSSSSFMNILQISEWN